MNDEQKNWCKMLADTSIYCLNEARCPICFGVKLDVYLLPCGGGRELC